MRNKLIISICSSELEHLELLLKNYLIYNRENIDIHILGYDLDNNKVDFSIIKEKLKSYPYDSVLFKFHQVNIPQSILDLEFERDTLMLNKLIRLFIDPEEIGEGNWIFISNNVYLLDNINNLLDGIDLKKVSFPMRNSNVEHLIFNTLKSNILCDYFTDIAILSYDLYKKLDINRVCEEFKRQDKNSFAIDRLFYYYNKELVARIPSSNYVSDSSLNLCQKNFEVKNNIYNVDKNLKFTFHSSNRIWQNGTLINSLYSKLNKYNFHDFSNQQFIDQFENNRNEILAKGMLSYNYINVDKLESEILEHIDYSHNNNYLYEESEIEDFDILKKTAINELNLAKHKIGLITFYNSEDDKDLVLLQKTIESLRNQTYSNLLTHYVMINKGISDEQVSNLQKEYPNIKIINFGLPLIHRNGGLIDFFLVGIHFVKEYYYGFLEVGDTFNSDYIERFYYTFNSEKIDIAISFSNLYHSGNLIKRDVGFIHAIDIIEKINLIDIYENLITFSGIIFNKKLLKNNILKINDTKSLFALFKNAEIFINCDYSFNHLLDKYYNEDEINYVLDYIDKHYFSKAPLVGEIYDNKTNKIYKEDQVLSETDYLKNYSVRKFVKEYKINNNLI